MVAIPLVGQDTVRPLQEQDSVPYYAELLSNPADSDDIFLAYQFYNREKNKSLERGDTLQTIQHLRQVAISQTKLGLYHESEASAVEALKLLDRVKNDAVHTAARVGLYNQLGRIYKALFDYKTALTYYDKALALTTDKTHINILQNNRALIFYELKDYRKAEREFEKIYENSLEQDDQKQLNRALDNLGFIQSKTGNSEALSNLKSSLEARIRDDDLEGMYSSYKNLSLYYLDRQDTRQARGYADKAYETARTLNSVSYIQDALALLMELTEDPLAARYKSISDSLRKAEITRENKYALIKYNYYEQEKLAAENALKFRDSQLANEIEKRRRIQYQVAVGLAIALLVVSVFVFRYRYRKGKREQVYQTETRISKKLHDELSNDVYNLMARMQQDTENEELIDYVQDIYQRTRDISRENSSIDTGARFPEALSSMLSGYIPETGRLALRGMEDINWDSVSREKKIVLYRVLQELMTNMRKHSKADLVAISLENRPGSLHVLYTDNGVGIKPLSTPMLKGGLLNAENRISSVGGTITFEAMAPKGFQAAIAIPV